MPPTEFPEQLERVKLRGRQLRRRRLAVQSVGSALALVALVVIMPAVVTDGSGPGTADVAVGERGDDGPDGFAATPGPRSEPAPPTVVDPGDGAQTDGPGEGEDTDGAGDTADPTPAGEPSAALDGGSASSEGCRNSYDPACGDLRWDPDPGPDQALRVEVTMDPRTPRVGERVTFTISAVDPDADIHVLDCRHHHDLGGGTSTTPCRPECPTPHGPWTPPPKERGEWTFELTHTYDQPGEHTATFTVVSGEACEPNPYAGEGTGTVTFVVLP